jgi:hypothetical protein
MDLKMSVCGVCCHPEVRAINNELFAGRMIRQVALKFELSIQALGRHRRRHLHFRSKTLPATTLEEKFRLLEDDAARLQLAAECGGGANVREALQVLRLRMSLLELEGKVAGRLSDGSTTTVNVHTGASQPEQQVSKEEMDRLIQEYIEVTGYAKEASSTPLLELPPGETDGENH